MPDLDQTAQLFSLVFVSGDDGIDLQSISKITGFDRSAVQIDLESLSNRLEEDQQNPIKLVENDQVYRLVTKSKFAPLLKKYYQTPVANSLSKASLETLTIIAYKQPVTRIEVDKIRGVNSSGAISRLVSRELIQESGRKAEVGRPLLYTTTNFFLDYFGLKKIDDLPELPDPEDLNNIDDDQIELFQKHKNRESKK
ncbi:SMC-Scp complex subunit ScpB [Oenococcus oeni]|uniref:Segregation and condensation protein B n=1 Tax=Oenococcus oeni (strain ATCC BAA-331 / PSU-1) TaxID=203123 RepID=Q04F58_OENOB|nr:SMC-Scp complex subunit ScpB [Oenococcus oeni]ABJ56914.1 condensin subunit ScpB [Oenococcus oeni PSU-1]OIK68195.1 SMC-Scp complex subunit ScpB [Oenococcus oeni]OIK99344.1 SMC-Scp complex subunit ScpB [Oenococcus oeni]OIL14752.1 SMC-Scp complex subunit ScpB [Oenococcus oeni]OIL29093.1 SMC-Scp complex subunit ScpB [Oenococcus oeni]